MSPVKSAAGWSRTHFADIAMTECWITQKMIFADCYSIYDIQALYVDTDAVHLYNLIVAYDVCSDV